MKPATTSLAFIALALLALGAVGCGSEEKHLTKDDFKKTDPPPGWNDQKSKFSAPKGPPAGAGVPPEAGNAPAKG